MRLNVLLSSLAVALLIVACLLPWITIESKSITITGINTAGTSFGKPAYFHFVWAALYLSFVFINSIWAKRVALVFAAFNIAWAARNFLLIPACAGGECPVRKAGLYILMATSLVMFFAPVITEKKLQ